jgi:hypothetical protein
VPILSQAYEPTDLIEGYAVLEPPNYGGEGGLVNPGPQGWGIFRRLRQNLIAFDPNPHIPAAQAILPPVGVFRQRIPLPQILNPGVNGSAPLSNPVIFQSPGVASISQGELQQLWNGET